MDSYAPLIAIIAAVVVVVFIAWMVTSNKSLNQALASARKEQNIDPIIKHIENDKTGDPPSTYNSAIKALWDSYDRELASLLIKDFVQRDDQVLIAQYWLQQVIEVEPELARTKLGEAFILEHFHEDIASQCGSACSGGSCKSGKCGGKKHDNAQKASAA